MFVCVCLCLFASVCLLHWCLVVFLCCVIERQRQDRQIHQQNLQSQSIPQPSPHHKHFSASAGCIARSPYPSGLPSPSLPCRLLPVPSWNGDPVLDREARTQDKVHSSQVSLRTHIPKASEEAKARCLMAALSSHNDTWAWTGLLCLPKLVLGWERSGKQTQRRQAEQQTILQRHDAANVRTMARRPARPWRPALQASNEDSTTEATGKPGHDGVQFDTTSALLFWALPSDHPTSAPANVKKKRNRAVRLMAPLVCLQSPATALGVRSAIMPKRYLRAASSSSVLHKCKLSSRTASAESPKSSLLRRRGSRTGLDQKKCFGVREPVLHSSAVFLASSSSTTSLCSSLWSEYNDTPDPNGSAAETQLRRNSRDDAARGQMARFALGTTCLNCEAHTLDTLNGTIHPWGLGVP